MRYGISMGGETVAEGEIRYLEGWGGGRAVRDTVSRGVGKWGSRTRCSISRGGEVGEQDEMQYLGKVGRRGSRMRCGISECGKTVGRDKID